MKTLFSCALTCQAWLPRSRRHLYRILEGHSSVILWAIARSHFSHIGFEYVEEIIGNDHIRFNQSITHYISNKCPNLTRLTLQDENKDTSPGPQIFYRSFLMHLSQFRNVKSLKLFNYKFESLTFLRKLLGALWALEEAYLDNVSWVVSEQRPLTVLLRATTWKLHTFKIAGHPSFDLISTWIAPSPRVTSVLMKGVPMEGSHPGLTLADATTIVELSKRLTVQSDPLLTFSPISEFHHHIEIIWSFMSQFLGICKPVAIYRLVNQHSKSDSIHSGPQGHNLSWSAKFYHMALEPQISISGVTSSYYKSTNPVLSPSDRIRFFCPATIWSMDRWPSGFSIWAASYPQGVQGSTPGYSRAMSQRGTWKLSWSGFEIIVGRGAKDVSRPNEKYLWLLSCYCQLLVTQCVCQ